MLPYNVLLLADVDFAGVPNNLTLSSASSIGSIILSILDDSLTEQSETIQLALRTTSPDLVVASAGPLQIEILDNDGMWTRTNS